jgi:hypothetical protein
LKNAAQKLSLSCAGGVEIARAKMNKAFLFLFVHKKKRFSFACLCPPLRQRMIALE